MNIGEKLKLIRRSRGLKQSDLEKLTKIKREAISQYESGIRTPNDEAVFRLSKALDIDTSALSNFNVNTPNELMHLFFELEDSINLQINKINNKYVMTFEDLENTNRELLYAFSAWYNARIASLAPTNNEEAKKQLLENYTLWKQRYPLSIKEKEAKDIKVFKAKYEALSKGIVVQSEKCNEVMKVVEDLITHGIKIGFSFNYGEKSTSQSNVVMSFNISQLNNINSPEDIYFAKFFSMLQKNFHDMGITINESSHTFENDTYINYQIFNHVLVSVIRDMEELQDDVESNNGEMSPFFYDYKYSPALEIYNISLKQASEPFQKWEGQ